MIFKNQQVVFFKDRAAAGELLAERLKKYESRENTLVLAIPRGGVVVAKKIAEKLDLALDIVITRKIGAPNQGELALGAVSPNGKVYWDKKLLGQLRIESSELRGEVEKEVEEIRRREKVYRQGRSPLDVRNKTVILIDDGIATGATALAAIRYLKSLKAKKIIVAVPVAALEIVSKIKPLVDQTIVLYTPEYLGAVGSFYQDFHPISDEEVIKLLV